MEENFNLKEEGLGYAILVVSQPPEGLANYIELKDLLDFIHYIELGFEGLETDGDDIKISFTTLNRVLCKKILHDWNMLLHDPLTGLLKPNEVSFPCEFLFVTIDKYNTYRTGCMYRNSVLKSVDSKFRPFIGDTIYTLTFSAQKVTDKVIDDLAKQYICKRFMK